MIIDTDLMEYTVQIEGEQEFHTSSFEEIRRTLKRCHSREISARVLAESVDNEGEYTARLVGQCSAPKYSTNDGWWYCFNPENDQTNQREE